MPADTSTPTASYDISPITDQELLKPGVGKLLVRTCEELKTECRLRLGQIDLERSKREIVTRDFHSADSQCRVLETKLEVLNNREAISQLLWGTASIVTALLIELLKSQQWVYAFFCLAAEALLAGALLLLHGFNKKPKTPEPVRTVGKQ